MQFIGDGNKDMLNTTKSKVKNMIFNLEIQRWKATCMMYSGLSIYMKCVKTINMHVWWSLARVRPYLTYKISAVLAICMGNQPRGLQCNFNRKLCYLCHQRQLDSPKHILFQCDAFEIFRISKLNKIIGKMPDAMKESFRHSSQENKVILFLSGLNCDSYIDEWSDVMAEICEFVFEIYRQRKNRYDDVSENGIT